jgi:MYND finger
MHRVQTVDRIGFGQIRRLLSSRCIYDEERALCRLVNAENNELLLIVREDHQSGPDLIRTLVHHATGSSSTNRHTRKVKTSSSPTSTTSASTRRLRIEQCAVVALSRIIHVTDGDVVDPSTWGTTTFAHKLISRYPFMVSTSSSSSTPSDADGDVLFASYTLAMLRVVQRTLVKVFHNPRGWTAYHKMSRAVPTALSALVETLFDSSVSSPSSESPHGVGARRTGTIASIRGSTAQLSAATIMAKIICTWSHILYTETNDSRYRAAMLRCCFRVAEWVAAVEDAEDGAQLSCMASVAGTLDAWTQGPPDESVDVLESTRQHGAPLVDMLLRCGPVGLSDTNRAMPTMAMFALVPAMDALLASFGDCVVPAAVAHADLFMCARKAMEIVAAAKKGAIAVDDVNLLELPRVMLQRCPWADLREEFQRIETPDDADARARVILEFLGVAAVLGYLDADAVIQNDPSDVNDGDDADADVKDATTKKRRELAALVHALEGGVYWHAMGKKYADELRQGVALVKSIIGTTADEEGLLEEKRKKHRRAGRKGTRSCAACGATDTKLRHCAGCRSRSYCSKECQRVDWMAGHRGMCSSMAATAAAAAT